jgi:hypothetical protein
MKQAKQTGFSILEGDSVKEFGGNLLKGNAKEKRPVSIKKAMHLVVRSSRARGPLSLLRKEQRIQEIVGRFATRFGVKVYRLANGGDHLHLTVLPRSRKAFNSFIRSITGLIARLVLGAERGNAKGLRFWDNRPYTKIVEWGREFRAVSQYLLQNTLEALGFIKYQPRKRHLKLRRSTA